LASTYIMKIKFSTKKINNKEKFEEKSIILFCCAKCLVS